MKISIKVHKQNAINLIGSRDRAKREADEAELRFIKLRADCTRLLEQIKRVESEGKDSFDPDKYNVPR